MENEEASEENKADKIMALNVKYGSKRSIVQVRLVAYSFCIIKQDSYYQNINTLIAPKAAKRADVFFFLL